MKKIITAAFGVDSWYFNHHIFIPMTNKFISEKEYYKVMKTAIFFITLCFVTQLHAEEPYEWSFEIDGEVFEGSWSPESNVETHKPAPQSELSFYEENKTLINSAAALAAAAALYALFSDEEKCFASNGARCSHDDEEHHTGLFETLKKEMKSVGSSSKSSICGNETEFKRFLKEAEITVFSGAGILTEMLIGGDGSLFGVSENTIHTTIDAVELTEEMGKAGLC